MNFYKINPDQLILIYDEADLPLGSIRIKSEGSAGGHNGIKSIIEMIGSQNFWRIRLGIDAPFMGKREDFVLSTFTDDEHAQVQSVISQLYEAVSLIIKGNGLEAMNRFNGINSKA